ncbi:tRNA(Ile2) 2-agmatinylcytidine synthetase [Natronoarchaeum philippinense]|uniref:tRNA(Ile2) 2-agmatinylcytidine synthetase TiaS n=1 Tax=Natronoarchaeum philippinense TaxID=558529 RepID=A0A285P8T1_NATPI|nr:tRNA(Ile)(2)-agmatinylcytidine synthase [Natronoarchaeum philippinense]SNZ17838.1 tRNA(Ile2) 2-agmatinylcytidine synthetase [Natronoarchaeum philippinense]
MTVIGLDDTDSRERGMCTTYAASRVARRVEAAGGTVERVLLVRLNPAVEHKTRGNAALAVHTDIEPDRGFEIARELIADSAEVDDPRTNPGLVVADHDPESAPDAVARFAREAVRDHHEIDDAEALIDREGYESAGWKNARGKIGALAAVGAWAAFEEWTYEHVSYREADRRGTPREIDFDSVFDAADEQYPAAWDTVDRVEGQAVCVPSAPGPILHGIRGDDADAVRAVAEDIESEPIESTQLFVTNQGTDAHLRDADLGAVREGRSYRVDGTVVDTPETREGGHVFLTIAEGDARRQCAAFEPTKRFRDRVRALRVGDRITACGEIGDETLKLEKFAVRELDDTELVTPNCPECSRSMKSAGADQGYRCRDCKTSKPSKIEQTIERDLEVGWYEVPPCARRHVAKPLVRGGFDAPTHPEW